MEKTISIDALAEDVLMVLFRYLDQTTDWPSCECTCQCWRKLVSSQRTVVHLPAWAPEPLQRLGILAARRSSMALRELEIHVRRDSLSTRQRLSEVVELVKSSASSLTSLVVNSQQEIHGIERPQLPVLLLQRLATAPTLPLRRLSFGKMAFSHTDAAPLFERLGRDDAQVEELCLDGWSFGDEGGGPLLLAPLMPRLHTLSLAGCAACSSDGVARMLQGSTLTAIDLSRVRLTPAWLRACLPPLAPLRRSLRRLGLSGFTGLPAASFAYALSACERLTDIDFSASLLNDAALRDAAMTNMEFRGAPAHLAGLQRVCLTECSNVTDVGLAELCNAAGPTLCSLAVGGPFTSLHDLGASLIATKCRPTLRHLRFVWFQPPASGSARSQPFDFTGPDSKGYGLTTIGAKLGSNLEHLDLSGSVGLPAAVLEKLLPRMGPGCTRLRVLELGGCDELTDEILAGYFPRAHSLRRLSVPRCTKLTDLTAELIATGRKRALRALRVLDISDCERISPNGQRKLEQAVPVVLTNGGARAGPEEDRDGQDPATTTQITHASHSANEERLNRITLG